MNLSQYFSKDYIKVFFTSFFIISFLFLYGLKFEYFQFRFLILLLLVPSAIKFYQDLRLKNYDFLLSFSIIFIVLILHTFLNLYYERVGLTNHTLFSIIFFLLIFTISFYHLDFINKNIDLLIKIFIVIFFISCLFSFYQYKPDAPFFCGGISDFFLSNSILENSNIGASKVYPVTYYDRIGEVRLSFREFIFLENSHLGMIAPSVIIYSIHRVASKEISVLGIFLLSIFFVICFIKSSTTLFVGTISSLTLIILFNYKHLNKKTLISFLILILLFFTILISNKECRNRFFPIDENLIQTNLVSTENEKRKVENKINKNLINMIKTNFNITGNLSSKIYFHALVIAKKSIVEKPFGWGLNRYNQAFNYFNKKQPSKVDMINVYNSKDGSNNLVKIIVEFGFFGIVFYLFIFLFLINNKVSLELKLFYLPFVITQSLRGAGYFNGGFVLIVFLMIFTFIRVYKKNILN